MSVPLHVLWGRAEKLIHTIGGVRSAPLVGRRARVSLSELVLVVQPVRLSRGECPLVVRESSVAALSPAVYRLAAVAAVHGANVNPNLCL